MNFEKIEFSSIDFESTGHREGIGDEPIQVGIAIMTGFNIDQKSFFRSFIKPSQENKVTARSRSVHRISDKDLTNAPIMYELWPKINGLLKKRVVVAHGAGTEKRFLRAFPMPQVLGKRTRILGSDSGTYRQRTGRSFWFFAFLCCAIAHFIGLAHKCP